MYLYSTVQYFMYEQFHNILDPETIYFLLYFIENSYQIGCKLFGKNEKIHIIRLKNEI